ncbi:MAG TPA: hypothetical protein HA272_02810, partial [Methanoregula sp.]|nr:hypothetical protein [Methanoregula sp.]
QGTNLLITVRDSSDNTTIPQATVFVNGANFAITNNNGQATLTHAGTEDQLIRVAMSGYDNWEKTVAKNVTNLYANLTRKTLTLKVNLVDSDTLEPVSLAKVNISAVNITEGKFTDAAGAAIFSVKANYYYTIDIAATNYQPQSTMVNIGTENKDVTYQLLSSQRFSVIVKDNDTQQPVSGAVVKIDGTQAGTTDSRGILSTPISRGKTYVFEITAPGYGVVSETRAITDADAIYIVEISKAAIGAFVYVFDERKAPLNGADVYFNGSLTGTTNEYGRSNFPSLISGVYLVEVRKSGFVPVSRTIVVSGQPEDHTFDLPFENAALSVFVQDRDQKNVPNATVLINGQNKGITDDRGQLVTRVKFNTPLNITVSKGGYASATVTEEVVQGNATASVNVILDKNLDLGLFMIIGAGIIVIILIFVAIRKIGGRKHRHVLRRDEI